MIPQIKEVNFGPNTANDYATLHQATVNLTTMGDRTITTQVRIDGNVVPDFTGWELEFRGERFILPTREPQARKDTSTKNSLIDLTFYSWPVYELKRYFFVEMSSTTSGTAIADKYDASLALNLENFVDAFNLVLDHYFNGRIQISLFGQGQGIYSTDPVSFEINYTKLWEVLQKVYEMYNVRWWFDYDSASEIYLIKMGYTADSIDDHDFSYGYKGGLLSFERTVQSDDLVNILLGRGGEKNLPYRYFKRTDPDNPGWTADPDAIPELANIYFDRLHDVNFRWYVRGWMTNPERDRSWEQEGYVYPTYSISPDSPYYFAYQKGATDAKFNPVEYVKDDESIAAHGEVWGALDDNDDIYPTIQGVTVNPYGRIDESVAISQIETDDISAYASAAAVETTIKDMKVSLSGNNVLTHTIYSEPFTIAQGETGNVTYRPFSKETVYPNFVYYDTTRSTLVAEPLSGGSDQSGTASYDEATGLYAVSGLPAGTYRLKLNLVLRVDRPATVATGTFGIENVVLTTSAANTNAWKPTFDIWVKNIWQTTQGTNESNKDYAERVWGPILGDRLGDEAKIVFSTGAMSISQDYEFVIADYPVPDRTKTLNGVPSEWKITVYKSDAEYQATGLYIPNASSTQPLAGDKFFFVGIDMPFQYVEWAEERLNQYKTDNLEGMSEISPTWTLKLDKVRINSLEDEDYGQKLADRLDAGVMIRTTDPRFTHGDILSLYIQSITWTWNEPSKGSPYIVPDVEVILADKVSAVESPISRLENDVDVISQTYVQSGDVEAVVRRVAGALFLKKTGESDSSSSPTTFSSKVTSRNFRKGGIGGAGWGLYEDNSRKFSQSSPATRADVSDEEETIEPRTVLEIDRLVVREEMEVNNLVINQISARGGREIISAARIETTLVRETDTSYVCYFDQKQNSVANLFQVNDIALGQVWSADNTELRFYKMLVTAVDVNSITLAKAGRYGSGSPQEGDVIVQYGNTTDARRQYVIIRDVVGGGHDRMLSGLNSVSAEGVEYYYAGVETGDTPRWFVGAREAEYAEYKDGVLNISGRLAVTSQLEKSDGSYVALSEYLNQLQDQVDGNIQTWFNAGEPSPLKDDPTATPNYPASEWETATDKNKHLGDLYYNETTGKAYRYQLLGGNYVWGMISDEEVAEALRAAQAAAAAAAIAQADADAAKARMDAWASDGVISPTEKQGIKDEIARIDSDHSNINAAYTLYGLGSPTAYNESYTAYRAQLVTLSASEPETITIPESFATNQISYYTQRTASLNSVDDAVKTGLTNLSTEIAGYNYLKRALGETTLVQGGLVLTSLIQLGQTESGTFNVYSGINGTFDQALPDPSRSIAAWYGGPMTDHEADPTSTTYAKSLFRMDGSGYLAGGMLNWGVENGQAFLNLNGEAVVGGLGGATLNDIANLMFEVVQYKTGHYAAKLKASAYYGGNLVPLDGLYAEGWMSAGGLSETSGGGGASYLHELLDVNLPSQIGDGQALIWDANLQKWTSGDVTIDTTPFERVANKVTSVSAASDNTQYPTAKAVYDIVNTMLSSVLRSQGITTTPITNGSTTNPIIIEGKGSYTASEGDVVIRDDLGLEFMWTGGKWRQFGDESSYALKTVTITGSGYLTGGGNLEAARTIDIADAVKTKIDNGATAYASLGNYLPLAGGTMSNTNLVNNLNADLLDGRHADDFAWMWISYAGGSHVGWVKIVEIPLNEENHFAATNLILTLGRQYAGPAPESYTISISIGWCSATLQVLNSDVNTQIIREFRIALDSTNHKLYFEYYVNPEFTTYTNAVYCKMYGGQVIGNTIVMTQPDSSPDSLSEVAAIYLPSGGASISGYFGYANALGVSPSWSDNWNDGASDWPWYGLATPYREVQVLSGYLGIRFHTARQDMFVGQDNVGIGTITPAYDLDVVGDVRASGKVYIGTSGGYLEVVNVGTTASPVYALKSTLPFFSDSWVSAGGVSDQGGSGSASYLHELQDVDDDLNPSTGQALVWDGTEWTAGGDISGYEKTANKVTSISASSTDTQYPSAKAVWTALDVKADSSALSDYLSLRGGTMSGSIHMPTGSSTTSGPMLHFRHESGGSQVFDAYVGANNSGTLAIYAANDLRLRPGNSSSHGLIITTTDITYNGTSLINSYLPLTGGTMTGTIHRSMMDDASSYQKVANWVNTSGDNLAEIGYWNIPQAVFINPNGSTDVWADEVGKYSLKISPSLSGLTFNTHTIWHAGNDGSGSGLDADVLDGKHANQFVPNDEFALIPHFALADIPIRKTAFGGIGWDQSQSYPYAGGGYLSFYMGSSLQSLLVLFPSYNLSEPPILYSSVDGADWGNSHQLAYTTSNVSSASKLRPVGTSSFDLNTALQGGGIIYNYFSVTSWQNAPNGIMYGCVAEFSENDDSFLAMQLAWDVNHDSTQSTKDLWFRSRNNLGWQNDWKQIATTASNVASATKLQTARSIWGQSFDGTGDIYGSIMNVLSIDFSGVPDAYGHGGFLDFHFNGSSADYTSRIIEDASGRLNANNALYAMYNGNVGIGTPTPAYKLDVAGDIRATGAVNIKIPYSSSQNTYANYFKFINSEDTDVAHISVTGQGHLGLHANRTIEFMADGTRRFIIGATSTQVSEKRAGFYPEINGTITLNSAGALSALGNGYNVGKADRFIRATYSKVIYLTDSVYIYYDTVNNCIRTNAPIVSDSYISAGGVSTT